MKRTCVRYEVNMVPAAQSTVWQRLICRHNWRPWEFASTWRVEMLGKEYVMHRWSRRCYKCEKIAQAETWNDETGNEPPK